MILEGVQTDWVFSPNVAHPRATTNEILEKSDMCLKDRSQVRFSYKMISI